jgi:hypothetical protein
MAVSYQKTEAEATFKPSDKVSDQATVLIRALEDVTRSSCIPVLAEIAKLALQILGTVKVCLYQ